MPPKPTLDSCLAKLSRAQHLVDELRRANLKFFEEAPTRVEIVANPKTGKQELIAAEVSPPPIGHSIIVGDFLYNLRSCLDHLVHQLIVANTGAEPTYRTYEFPICKTASRFDKEVERLLRDVGPDGVKRVKEVQPFTFERPSDTALHMLNEMGLVDKHRLPLLAVVRGRVSAMTAEDETAELMWVGGGYDDLVENGTVLATFDATVPATMRLNAIVQFDMALADGPHDLPATRVMEMMWRVVRQIVEHVGMAIDPARVEAIQVERRRMMKQVQDKAERARTLRRRTKPAKRRSHRRPAG